MDILQIHKTNDFTSSSRLNLKLRSLNIRYPDFLQILHDCIQPYVQKTISVSQWSIKTQNFAYNFGGFCGTRYHSFGCWIYFGTQYD